MSVKIKIKLYKGKYCILKEDDGFDILQDIIELKWSLNEYRNTFVCSKSEIRPVLFFLRDNFNCDIKYKYSDEGKSVRYRPLELYQTFDENLNLIEFDAPFGWYITKQDPSASELLNYTYSPFLEEDIFDEAETDFSFIEKTYNK